RLANGENVCAAMSWICHLLASGSRVWSASEISSFWYCWATFTEIIAQLLRPQSLHSPPMRGWPSAHRGRGVSGPNRSLRALARCPYVTPLAFLSRSEVRCHGDWRTNCSCLRGEVKRLDYSFGCALGNESRVHVRGCHRLPWRRDREIHPPYESSR